MDYACELCGDVGTARTSAAVADSANHDKMSELSFTDVVCWIDFWVCCETEEVFEIAVCEVVDESAHGIVFVMAPSKLEHFSSQLVDLFLCCFVVESLCEFKDVFEVFVHVLALGTKCVFEFSAVFEYV